jgi:hypothetical protein
MVSWLDGASRAKRHYHALQTPHATTTCPTTPCTPRLPHRALHTRCTHHAHCCCRGTARTTVELTTVERSRRQKAGAICHNTVAAFINGDAGAGLAPPRLLHHPLPPLPSAATPHCLQRLPAGSGERLLPSAIWVIVFCYGFNLGTTVDMVYLPDGIGRAGVR